MSTRRHTKLVEASKKKRKILIVHASSLSLCNHGPALQRSSGPPCPMDRGGATQAVEHGSYAAPSPGHRVLSIADNLDAVPEPSIEPALLLAYCKSQIMHLIGRPILKAGITAGSCNWSNCNSSRFSEHAQNTIATPNSSSYHHTTTAINSSSCCRGDHGQDYGSDIKCDQQQPQQYMRPGKYAIVGTITRSVGMRSVTDASKWSNS